MKYSVFLFCILFFLKSAAQKFETLFELSEGKQSVTYAELMSYYKVLDEEYTTVKMEEIGSTDAAHSLSVVYYSNDAVFNVKRWKQENKIIILINNGIHPGEPDGIDASMMLLRDAANHKIEIPDNIVLAVVPVFNIGGMLNRGKYSRANQNGPEEYGFRGNGQNLDLNRDFIKMDARETRSLVKLFHKLNPDVFIDNHVSNGADYQHIVTLLSTQYNKLGGCVGLCLRNTFEPNVYEDMKRKGYDLVPYVNHWDDTPDKGWTAFHEGPRFASGYAAMFHTYAFVTETHMLKPYKQRVVGTYELMKTFIKEASINADEIKRTRKQDLDDDIKATSMPVEWVADTTVVTNITFKGYDAGYKSSEVSGKPRLYYDRTKPYTKQVPIYNTYKAKQIVRVPKAYVLPRGWHKVISRLKMNNVMMYELQDDSALTVSIYRIQDYETVKKPYEGHYLHSKVKVAKSNELVKLNKGDYIIPVDQQTKRFVMEVLEPTAPDSYFAWGFFDAILQQKGGFSDYVFEDDAALILKKDARLKEAFEEKKRLDKSFADNANAQLDYIYRHSVYNEEEYMRYPVFRLE